MLLSEKIAIIRKMNNLTQEAFAEELGISRQALSKWENGTSMPDVQMLLRIADYYNITLDQLVRDEFDLPMAVNGKSETEGNDEIDKFSKEKFDISEYIGKVCDVSMNSFNFSVIRNVQIIGIVGNMVCFVKKNRLGYFNIRKSLGILAKDSKDYAEKNEIVRGKCTVYVNKGTYFGGQTYIYNSIERVTEEGIEVHTGKFAANISFEDLSVILMSDKIEEYKG